MKQVKQEDLVNWWLEKYHNTNLTKVIEDNPEWKDNPSDHSRDFHLKYAVTKEQHDEWEVWAKEYTRKVTKCSKKFLEHQWPWISLDASPSIKKELEIVG